MVAGDNEHDEHDRLVFTLGPSSACPWTLERAPSGNGQPAVELAPVDDVQGEGAGLHRILSQSVSTAQGGHIAGKSLGLVSIVPRTVSVPSAKRKARDAPTHKAAPRGPAHSTARKSTPQTPPVAPVAQMHHGLPTRLSDLKTPVAQLQLRGFPCAPAQQSTAAGSRKQLAKPALPSIPTPDRRRSGALLGIPTEPTGMALAFPGQPGRREKIIPLKSPAPTPATAGLLHGLCTPAHHSRPPLYLAACSSRAQQPVAPAHTPALVQPQAPTQYKSPMTMADLGLPARTGPARQMSAPHSTNYKHAIIPLLASPMRPGPEAAAVSPEAKPSRAQLLANVPKQVLPILATCYPTLLQFILCKILIPSCKYFFECRKEPAAYSHQS